MLQIGDRVYPIGERYVRTNRRTSVLLMRRSLGHVESKQELERDEDECPFPHKARSTSNKNPIVAHINDPVKDTIAVGDFNSKLFRTSYENKQMYIKSIPGLFQDIKTIYVDVNILKNVVRHPYILRYFDGQVSRNQLFLVMEICETSLEEILSENVTLPISRVKIIQQVCQGLAYLHENNIVHGNLKPSNILISTSTMTIKLSDFGMHNVYSELLQKFIKGRMHIGLVDWMAPEVLQSFRGRDFQTDQKPESDIFSLGCIFYFMISKQRHPFGDILERFHNTLLNHPILDEGRIKQHDIPMLTFISIMISHEIEQRPTAKTVLHMPIFWIQEQQLAFILSIKTLVSHDKEAMDKLLQLERVDSTFHLFVNSQSLPDDVVMTGPNSKDNVLLYFQDMFPHFLAILWIAFQKYKYTIHLSPFYYEMDEYFTFPNFLLDKYPALEEIPIENYTNVFIKITDVLTLPETEADSANDSDESWEAEYIQDNLKQLTSCTDVSSALVGLLKSRDFLSDYDVTLLNSTIMSQDDRCMFVYGKVHSDTNEYEILGKCLQACKQIEAVKILARGYLIHGEECPWNFVYV